MMRGSRYNIASMLAAISLVGVGFAALREATDQWDSGVFSLTLGLLLGAALLAIHTTEARRAFWMGFALFGWGYLGLSLEANPEGEVLRLHDVATIQSGYSFLTPGRGVATAENLVRIGHSLVALIVGWLGGALSRKFRPSD